MILPRFSYPMYHIDWYNDYSIVVD